jgi:hypothetical protein
LAALAVPDLSQLFDAVEYETEINEHIDPRYLGKIQSAIQCLAGEKAKKLELMYA